jgi:hypothetical protein
VSSISVTRLAHEESNDISLSDIYHEMYQSLEALESGDPRWELYGKHLAAYHANRHAKEAYADYVNLQKEFFLKTKSQQAGAWLGRRQAMFEDRTRHEQLLRMTKMALEYLDALTLHFSAERFAYLTDDQKAEIIQDLYERGVNFIFTSGEIDLTSRALPEPTDSNVRIIDMDEF